MKRNIYIAGAVLLVIIGGIYIYLRQGPSQEQRNHTLSEVEKHNDATSCYAIINGSVYDLTIFINLHPGGERPIKSVCGKDGSEKFMKKHKGGAAFVAVLNKFKLGTITK